MAEQVLILQPDAAAGDDAELRENAPTVNDGDGVFNNFGYNGADRFRTIVEFDISSIPNNATIASGSVILSLIGGIGQQSRAGAIRRLTEDRWIEGDGTSGCTWNTYDGTNG